MLLRNAKKLLPALFLSTFFFLGLSTASAQLPNFSGIMTLHDPTAGSYVPFVMPDATFVTHTSNPQTGECTVHFAGMECQGIMNGGTCDFNSEDCNGPQGWECYVYSRGSEQDYGRSFGIRCTHALYPDLSLHYSGAAMDLGGIGLTIH